MNYFTLLHYGNMHGIRFCEQLYSKSEPEVVPGENFLFRLRHHYRARNSTFDENHFLVSS